MCFSAKPKKTYHQMFNRMTECPIKFDQSEIEQLKKKFDKVAGFKADIQKAAFKKNMGILGLQSAFEFSDRLFNSFDIDNDGKISFHDFLEYMEVLKAGTDKHKARISFKLIDYNNKNKFNKQDFIQYLNDFFKSWSSITNMTITPEIKERTDLYVEMIFAKVKLDKGTDVIDFKYYSQKLYKDKQFLEAFQFITQGVASIFISDRYTPRQNDHSWILWNVLKELRNLQQTVFEMSSQSSYQFKDMSEQSTLSVPFAPGYIKPNSRNSKVKQSELRLKSKSKTKKIEGEQSSTNFLAETPKAQFFNFFGCANCEQNQQQTFHQSNLYQNMHCQSNIFYKNQQEQSSFDITRFSLKKSFLNSKKLDYIRTCIQKILDNNSITLNQLQETFNQKNQVNRKKQKQTIKNVHKKSKITEGNMIFFGDDNWNMVLNMMIGIQMAVRSVKGYQQLIYEQPRDFQLKYYFELVPRRFGGEQYQSTIYSFTDYAPNTFNHIRKIFQIDNEDYIMSIGPNRLMASLMLGEVNSMTSLTSHGKSGSFFYYTADGKYMLKTIRYKEYKFLRTLLKDYYGHIKQNPQTLITRFFGLHKLLQKNQKGQIIERIYFVIMANVFNTNQKIVQRYDLKGSWYGRQNMDTDSNATKKDLDFLKRTPLIVSEQERQKLLQIIKRDSQFFRRHEIIDYSLLVGVIRNNNSEIKQSPQMMQTILYGNQQNGQRYIFGIIDILTCYDSKKVMEYYFKKTFYGEGISAVPPEDYARRFYSFISDKVLSTASKHNKNWLIRLQGAQ